MTRSVELRLDAARTSARATMYVNVFPNECWEGNLKKWVRGIVIGGVCLAGLASILVHPFGGVKKSVSDKPLWAGASVDRAVIQIVERSCQDSMGAH